MTDWMKDDDATIVDQEGGEHSVVAHVAYHRDEPIAGSTWGGRIEGLSLTVARRLLEEPGRRVLRISGGGEGEIVPLMLQEQPSGTEMHFRGLGDSPEPAS